jgi:hypothetical protein
MPSYSFVDLVHNYSNSNWVFEYLSKLYYILIIASFESCGVDTLHTILTYLETFKSIIIFEP